jgi:uncharacterized protein (TIGR04255 family)
MEQRHALETTFMVAGDKAPQFSQDQAANGWQLRSVDGAWTVTLDAEFFSLETSAYTTWTDFRERLDHLVSAVIEAYGPALESRLGLRFVDEIIEPEVTEPGGWRGWIRDELLGPLVHADFAGSVRAVQQHVDFDAGDGYQVRLRHGTGPVVGERRWVYVIDHDCFRQAGRPFSHGGILAAAEDLHRIALQMFQAAITPELYAHLEPQGVHDPQGSP